MDIFGIFPQDFGVFSPRMSSSSKDCSGGGGFNMFNFATMSILIAQMLINLVNTANK